MKLNISYTRPCGERNKLVARLDFEGRPDIEEITKKFNCKVSSELGITKIFTDGMEVIVSENHMDVREAETESDILKFFEKIRPMIR